MEEPPEMWGHAYPPLHRLDNSEKALGGRVVKGAKSDARTKQKLPGRRHQPVELGGKGNQATVGDSGEIQPGAVWKDPGKRGCIMVGSQDPRHMKAMVLGR